jgi:hypothetical protein
MFGDIGGDKHSELTGVMVAAEDGCQYCGKGVLLLEKVCDEGSSVCVDGCCLLAGWLIGMLKRNVAGWIQPRHRDSRSAWSASATAAEPRRWVSASARW